ncbi:MAG: hypothetical protein WAL79_10535 [Nitrososphaeraceae archaeon]
MKSRVQISLLGIGSSLIITSIVIGFGCSNPVSSVSEVYNNKTTALGNNVKNPVVLTPNESYESHSLLTELRLDQLYFP